MGWTARIVIAVIVLLVVGAGALGIYGSMKTPPQHDIETPVTPPSGG
ncbi:MAG TPA: hypothetical protein VGG48_18510 [Rhizomicrobium sp.]|jgi:hypothetical protein